MNRIWLIDISDNNYFIRKHTCSSTICDESDSPNWSICCKRPTRIALSFDAKSFTIVGNTYRIKEHTQYHVMVNSKGKHSLSIKALIIQDRKRKLRKREKRVRQIEGEEEKKFCPCGRWRKMTTALFHWSLIHFQCLNELPKPCFYWQWI